MFLLNACVRAALNRAERRLSGRRARSWVFTPPLPHPYSGWWPPSDLHRPSRNTAAPRMHWDCPRSWVLGECQWGSGLSQIPLNLGVPGAEGDCGEVSAVTSVPTEDWSSKAGGKTEDGFERVGVTGEVWSTHLLSQMCFLV